MSSPPENGGSGEIAVKSRYLAVGYWRQPDLTCKAFTPDPAGSEARIYCTGDIGRLLPDGCLECLGRMDFQVKIRGYRVETAEIELALLEHEAVQETVVVAQQERTDETRWPMWCQRIALRGFQAQHVRRRVAPEDRPSDEGTKRQCIFPIHHKDLPYHFLVKYTMLHGWKFDLFCYLHIII